MTLVFILSCSCTSLFAQEEPQPTVKLLSWNIFMLPQLASKCSAVKRAHAIGAAIDSSKYDVIVFQEAFRGRARRIIGKALQNKFPFHAGPANRKIFSLRTNSGIWMLSKYRIISSHSIVYNSRGGMDAMSRKGALLAELLVGRNRIQIIGTHLQSAGGPIRRISQCEQLYKELLQPFRKYDVPQIICGDLNINKYTAYPTYMDMLSQLDARDGKLDSARIFSFDPRGNDLLADTTRISKLIDYVLIGNQGNGASFSKYSVKPIRQSWDRRHADLSDHYAMEANITLDSASKQNYDSANARFTAHELLAQNKSGKVPGIVFAAEYQILRHGGLYAPAIGLSVSRQINSRWKIGIAVASSRHYKQLVAENDTKLKSRLKGIQFDYTIFNHRTVSLSFPVMLGVGDISIVSGRMVQLNNGTSTLQMDKIAAERGTFIRPGLSLGINLCKAITVSAGARTAIFLDSDTHSNLIKDQLGNFTISAGLNVRIFSGAAKKNRS